MIVRVWVENWEIGDTGKDLHVGDEFRRFVVAQEPGQNPKAIPSEIFELEHTGSLLAYLVNGVVTGIETIEEHDDDPDIRVSRPTLRARFRLPHQGLHVSGHLVDVLVNGEMVRRRD
jgi:hypothetical protein